MAEISIDFWSFIILAGSLQGLILAFFFLSSKRLGYSNKLMFAILWFLIWVQMEFFFVRSIMEPLRFEIFYGTRYGSWLAIGPLLFVYTKSILSDTFKPSLSLLLHFAPFLIFTITIPLLFSEAIPERGKYYGMLTVIRNTNMGITPIQNVYGVLFFLQFIHASIYAFLGVGDLIKQGKLKKRTIPQLDHARMKWVKYCCLIFGFVMLSSVLYFYLLFYSDSYKRWMDYLYILPSTGVIYILAISAYRKPYLFRDDLKYVLSRKKYAKTPLDGQLSLEYKERLTNYIKSEKAYLNPNIRLVDVANALSIPKHQLSRVINEQFHCNFNEFINKYRIREAQEIMTAKDNTANFLNIAYAVGFNNKASFNNYFKRLTSMTPKEYQKKYGQK
ncbi:helix-turn-helix domain-containing protein [Spongiimicrobium salis]|uniref:helix-turn-helix domain-containing protein n=1 Tax=Spongiimicrobium salis TaxID=1667022 RepID=UPI00374D656F